jgi:hypothetical protein
VTRTAEYTGWPVTVPPIFDADVPVTRQGGLDVVSVDLDGRDLVTGRWRVAVLDMQSRLLGWVTNAFVVLPRPGLTGIGSSRLCSPPPIEAVLDAVNLPVGYDVEPTATLQDTGGETPLVAGYSGCSNFLPPFLCTRLTAALPTVPGVGVGNVAVRLKGAEARLPGGQFTFPVQFGSPGMPGPWGLIFVADASQERKVWSEALVRVGDGVPLTASMGGVPVPLRAEDCTTTPDPGVKHCRTLFAMVPQGSSPGDQVIDVTTESGCTTATSLRVAERPVLTGLRPSEVCQRSTQSLTLLGSGFQDAFPYYSSGGTGPWTGFQVGRADALPLGRHLVKVELTSATPVVASDSVWITVFPGPVRVFDGSPSPRMILSTASRKVTFWATAYTGRLSAWLVPVGGGAPLPVTVTSSGSEHSFPFPALGGDQDYLLSVSDESPCGSQSTYRPLSTRTDPILLHWDFDPTGPLPSAYPASGTSSTAVDVSIGPYPGAAGSAVLGRRVADGEDWYFGWFPYVALGDPGVLSFDLYSSGSGGASSAIGLLMQVDEDTTLSHLNLKYALQAPVHGQWTHYEVRLDDPTGWTVTEYFTGDRPARVEDFRGRLSVLEVLGSWWSGPGETALDNLVIELAR